MLDPILRVSYGEDCFDRVIPHLEGRYRGLASGFWELLGQKTESPPHLHVVHSPAGRPATMRSSAATHIVFDQYLGQVFSRLTRLERCDAPTNVVDSYLFKLYGQRLLMVGRRRDAAAMALLSSWACDADERDRALAETTADLLTRGRMTLVQEAFAIGHEVMHIVLEDHDRREVFQEWFDEVLEVARDRLRTTPAIDAQSSIDADIAAVRSRRGLEDTGRFDSRTEQSHTDVTSVLASFDRPEVQEEAMCDLFAALTARTLLDELDMSSADILTTSTLALQHLRLVQYMDNRVARGDGAPRVGEHLLQSIARVTLLRTGLAMTIDTELTLKGRLPADIDRELEGFHERAVTLNQTHTSVVFDHLMVIDLDKTAVSFGADPRVRDDVDRLVADPAALRSALGFPRAASVADTPVL